jgi:hypothetical protein
MSLQMNLRPWRTSADLVNAMKVGLSAGKPAHAVLEEWERASGVQLNLDDGIPREYQGVGIFINGYREFARIVRER